MTAALTAVEAAEKAAAYFAEHSGNVTYKDLAVVAGRSERWGRMQLKALREEAAPQHEDVRDVKPKPLTQIPEQRTEPVAASTEAPVPAPAPFKQHLSARFVVWAGFLLGVGASVAANVASAEAGLTAKLVSGFAPVALILAVEALSRPKWLKRGKRWTAARYLGAGAVAAVAAAVSYEHQRELALSVGESVLAATILPLAVDGLVLVCATALLAMKDDD